MDKNFFEVLNSLDVNGHTEQKNGLTYLSWAWAVAEVQKRFPGMIYEVCKFDNGNGVLLPYMYDKNTGYMCETKVTIDGITKEMWLPVMDSNNHAMKSELYTIHTKYRDIEVMPATMFDVNKTIMRCLTKNLAMFGLGLYIYAGEDLPETEDKPDDSFKKEVSSAKAKETREFNKKVEEYNKSAEGLKLRYDSCYAYIKKLPKIEPVKDKMVMDKVSALLKELSENSMKEEYDNLEKLLNEKLPAKEEEDIIPY